MQNPKTYTFGVQPDLSCEIAYERSVRVISASSSHAKILHPKPVYAFLSPDLLRHHGLESYMASNNRPVGVHCQQRCTSRGTMCRRLTWQAVLNAWSSKNRFDWLGLSLSQWCLLDIFKLRKKGKGITSSWNTWRQTTPETVILISPSSFL